MYVANAGRLLVCAARQLTLLAAVAGLVPLSVSRAHADPVGCQRAIGKETAKFAQAKMKIAQKCSDGVLTGARSGPCPDAIAAEKVAKAESKLRAALDKNCGGVDRSCGTGDDDDALAAIGWSSGACPNFESGSCANAIANCDDVGTCLACVTHAATDQAIALYYGALQPSQAGSTVQRCQRAIGKETTKFFVTKSKALRKCEDLVVQGAISGPCPDGSAAGAIAAAEAKKVSKICAACGGADHTCGGGDDLTPATIGFAAQCPAVTIPGGAACGGPVSTLQQLVTCVDCVTAFKADCLDALTVPGQRGYPAECNGGSAPTPTGGGTTASATPGASSTAVTATRTATPSTPTPTRTATPVGATATRTVTPTPAGTPTPPPACVLPSPFPAVVSFVGAPNVDLDTGWTGQAHDLLTADDGTLTASRLSNCDLDTASATCGQCMLTGPVDFPGASKNCRCVNLADRDGSTFGDCDPETPSSCSGGETCQCYYGPPLPITSGGVPVCVLNRVTAPLTGTANVANAGPHAGEGEALIQLEAAVHNGLLVEKPCPVCMNDPSPRDGVRGGTCSGGAKDGQPCDVAGTHPLFGDMAFECPPATGAGIGNLRITFNKATTGTTSLGTAGVKCTAPGVTTEDCFCDTCASAAAEPCNSNADCQGGAVCGGRRCLGGANAGAACTTNSQCASSACGRPGLATSRNQCNDGVCSPNPSDPTNPSDGLCESGPFDTFCSRENFRGCAADADCTPPPAGNCDTCLPGQVCGGALRQCFLDPIVRHGTASTQNPVLAATFCIPPTAAAAVNAVAGLPGPGALVLGTHVFESGAQCGNDVVDAGEQCDGTADTACPDACLPSCQCPSCGDGQVNQPGEQCDRSDDSACPGQCQPSCTCTAAVCGNGVVEFGEDCDGAADTACPGACQANCQCGAVCGDGVVDPGEQCDGGGSTACPPAACQANCTCGPFCGNNQIDPGEECDGNGTGACLGTCQGDCTCAPVCGDNHREAGELCDGTDDALCHGQCTAACTCPANGRLTFSVIPGADLDTGWTGIAHNFQVQTGSTITGELSSCDGVSDQVCDFFGNVGSFCAGDPSRSCTADSECSGAGTCVINTFGPPLPLSAGGVPACIINRFATDATGTYNLQTGSMELFTRLNSLVHLGIGVSRPCPICDCGRPDVHDCQIGETGTCSDIVGSPPCHVQGNGPFGPTSNECPPSSGLNVSGGGLDIPFLPLSTGTVSFASSQPCDASGHQSEGCWCDGQPQASACLTACDGGGNDAQPCDTNADCPGAGVCKPLCRQVPSAPVGEGRCVAGPVDQTCAGAPEVGCQRDTDCPTGKGPCGTQNRRCFMDPIVRVGTPGTTTAVGAATFCIPATSGQAINQTAGLPGPGALRLPTSVTVTRCGDNAKNGPLEECDGTDSSNCPGACLANCTCPQTCGNNVVEFGEQCDGTSSSACPGQCGTPNTANACLCPPVCGDGLVGPGEQCDPGGINGAPPNAGSCPGVQCGLLSPCQCPPIQLPTCANNTLDPGEVCELPALGCGPLQACLGCQQCFPPPGVIPQQFICGNGNIEPTEVCELPAAGCGDGELCLGCTQCVPALPLPVCGNGNVETGEVCDLPAVGCAPLQACLLCQQCVDVPVAICGNGNIEPGEVCELPQRGCGPLQVCVACTQCAP